MTAPTHIAIGMAAAVALVRLTGQPISAAQLLLCLLGALAPDIDADNGSIARPGVIFGRFLPRPLARFLDGLGLLVSRIAFKLCGHRRFFHWPLLGLLMILAGYLIENLGLLLFGLGYLSHIIADLFTTGGVPAFGPFSKEIYSVLRLKTGSKIEGLLCIAIVILVAVFGFATLPAPTRFWLVTYYERFADSTIFWPTVALLCGAFVLALLAPRPQTRRSTNRKGKRR